MQHRLLAATIVGIFVYAPFALAQMSSNSFLIRWDTVSTGGSDTGSSTSYILRDTIEDTIGGRGTSTSYAVDQGYRGGVFDQVISFSLLAQDISDPRSATALSGTTVTVSSVSGMAVGNYIAVVQDLGVSQVSAIGKVASVGASTLIVDSWTNAGTIPTVDGAQDYVYPLSGAALALGQLSDSSVRTGIVAFEVSVDSSSGYVVQVADDGNLRFGSPDINDVSDGAVSEGAEEYGARSSDSSLASSTFDTSDAAVTTTFQDLVTASSVSMNSRSFVTMKASISTASTAGTYAHVLSFIASGNF